MASTVSITFQGSIVSASLSIAYVTVDQQITTLEFKNTPITIEVAKGTLISMAGYTTRVGVFLYPVVQDLNNVDLPVVFSKSVGSYYYIEYAVIAKEDTTYKVIN